MNRLKKEIRKKGIMLECDYPYLPFNGIEAVKVNSEQATLSTYHVCAGWMRCTLGRDLTFRDFISGEVVAD